MLSLTFAFAVFCRIDFDRESATGMLRLHKLSTKCSIQKHGTTTQQPDIKVWSARVRPIAYFCKMYNFNFSAGNILHLLRNSQTPNLSYYAYHSKVKSIETQSIFIVTFSKCSKSFLPDLIRMLISGFLCLLFLLFFVCLCFIFCLKNLKQNNYAQLKMKHIQVILATWLMSLRFYWIFNWHFGRSYYFIVSNSTTRWMVVNGT